LVRGEGDVSVGLKGRREGGEGDRNGRREEEVT